jgi:hypothetical protein
MVSENSTVAQLFLDFSHRKLLGEYWSGLRSVVESLTDEQVWWRPNDSSNSIGNLLLHLDGNVRQWLISSFRQVPSTRNRPAEFAERGAIPARTLLDSLSRTVADASNVIASLTAADLAATMHIQGYTVTGLDAVYHVVEHFGVHYGQIVYITKLLRETDLGFYRELDRTGFRE